MPSYQLLTALGQSSDSLHAFFQSTQVFLTVPVACRSKPCIFRLPWAKSLANWRAKTGMIKYLASVSWCLHCCRLCVRIQLHCACPWCPAHTRCCFDVTSLSPPGLAHAAGQCKGCRNSRWDMAGSLNQQTVLITFGLTLWQGLNFSWFSCKNYFWRSSLDQRLGILKLILILYPNIGTVNC